MTAEPVLVKIPNYVTYFCFTPDTSLEIARAAFIRRYGHEPKEVTRDSNLVWCGPVQNTHYNVTFRSETHATQKNINCDMEIRSL